MQKKRLATKASRGVSFPKVHAIVYDVANGLVKELDMKGTNSLKHGKIYSLLGSNLDDMSALFALEVEDPPVASVSSWRTALRAFRGAAHSHAK